MGTVSVSAFTGRPLLDLTSYARRGPGRRDRLRADEVALITRTVRHAPEVMVKVLTRASTEHGSVARHFGYLGRDGELALETDEGERLVGRAVGKELVERWDLDVDAYGRRAGVYTYGGRVELAQDPYQAQQPDVDGRIRSVWIFPVRRIDEAGLLPIPQAAVRKLAERQRKDARRLTDADISARAELRSRPASERTTTAITYVRDEYVAEYARRRARGICDLCRHPAPFLDRNGQPHLESHHIVWLARGGDDSISNTVALCPNCHRKMHVLDLPADRRLLQQRALQKLVHTVEPQPSDLLSAASG